MHSGLSLGEQHQFDQSTLELRRLVLEAVLDSLGDSILLSGGLDTSIVAAAAAKSNPNLHAFTVILKDYPAPDLEFSKLISSRLAIDQAIIWTSLDDIEKSLPEVIRVLRSFDPMEIRNSVAIFLGLKRAELEGFMRVLTGDAADELFAGYSFVNSAPKEDAVPKLHHLWEVMHFSSIPLASSLGMEAFLPFLDPRVKDYATSRVPFEFLVGRNGTDSDVFGKFILRKAFEDLLPREIVWRKKTPIEYGSGTTVLPQIYSKRIDDLEFTDKKDRYLSSDKVRIRDKEQLQYYEIYRNEFGGPPPSDLNRRICPACRANVQDSANFCTTCGEYPI